MFGLDLILCLKQNKKMQTLLILFIILVGTRGAQVETNYASYESVDGNADYEQSQESLPSIDHNLKDPNELDSIENENEEGGENEDYNDDREKYEESFGERFDENAPYKRVKRYEVNPEYDNEAAKYKGVFGGYPQEIGQAKRVKRNQ